MHTGTVCFWEVSINPFIIVTRALPLCVPWLTVLSFYPLRTDDAFWCRQFSGAYGIIIIRQFSGFIASILKICSALAERVRQGGGWVYHSGWQRMAAVTAACRKALVNARWAICLPAQTGVENAPFTLYGLHFWHFRQRLVWRNVLWSEGPDYNEWVWPRSWTHRECVNKALTQVSSASSKQKWN